MTIDRSAVLAILRSEPEDEEFAGLIAHAHRRLISAASVLEVSLVLEGSRGKPASRALDEFLSRARMEVVPLDAAQLSIARRAFTLFGKGRHEACLNYGDCVSYALSQWSGEPLLYKGSNLARTDVASVR